MVEIIVGAVIALLSMIVGAAIERSKGDK